MNIQTSQSSTPYSSQNMEDVESEIRRLRMELRQTMDMYRTTCREALDAKQKLTDFERCKIEEQQKLYEGRSPEEAAITQMMEEERAKARAAVEAAEKSNRIAELEAKKRLTTELLAFKEVEEKRKSNFDALDDAESKIIMLKMELKQMKDLYNAACREASDAKHKLREIERCKIEEKQKLNETRSNEERAKDDVESDMKRLRMELKHMMDIYEKALKEASGTKQKESERRNIEEQKQLFETHSHEES